MSHQLRPALHPEMTIEGSHVLVRRCRTQTEAPRDLLLAVALEQAGERPPQSRRKRVRAWFARTDKRAADQPAELCVEKAQQLLLPGRELPFSRLAMQTDDIDRVAIADRI